MSYKNVLIEISDKHIEETITCDICFDILNNPYDCLQCSSTYCYNCIIDHIASNKRCPSCKEKIESDSDHHIHKSSNKLSHFIEFFKEYFKSQKETSIYSFSGKKLNARDSVNKDDKLDRILDTVMNLQNLIFFKNSSTPRDPFLPADTPKFSINLRKESYELQPNKADLSEINEKLLNIEMNLESNYNIQKIMNSEINKALEKLLEDKKEPEYKKLNIIKLNSSPKKTTIKQPENNRFGSPKANTTKSLIQVNSPKKEVNAFQLGAEKKETNNVDLYDRISLLEKNILSKINKLDNSEKLISELKTSLLEFTLDSNNVVLEKLINIEKLINN
jgi:hypothetical protein